MQKILRTLLFGLALCAPLAGGARAAEAPPACVGTDLLADAERTHPDAYAAILAETRAIPNGEGLLWSVRKAGGPTSYLFGTMHGTDPGVVAMTDRLVPLLPKVKTVATELGDMNAPANKALLLVKTGLAIAADPNHLGDFVTSDEDRQHVARIGQSLHLSMDTALRMPPWLLVATAAEPACEIKRLGASLPTVDDRVVDLGKKAGAAIVAIETIDEQLAVMRAIDPRVCVRQLMVLARRPAMIEDAFATLDSLYRQQRVATVLSLTTHLIDETPEDVAADKAVVASLIETRNEVMAKRTAPLIDAGPVLIAVGALHLVGERGLVAKLRARGYDVERVP